MPAPLLEAKELSRFFEPNTWALTSAHLTIYPGESIAITGASGSGKSTLLALIGLLDTPTSGELILLGENLSTAKDAQRTLMRKENISFVFQAFHLVQHLSALENVRYALELRGTPRHQAAEKAKLALQEVGLSHRSHARPSQLSGGEQQRVAVARALASSAALLLCDEPTGNLDTQNSHKILDLLLNSRSEQQSLVIITHEPDIAARCDRQFTMTDGKLTEEKQQVQP
ncbi:MULTISPECIES: ABC transporter ATP-binding protein [unclassified Rothia (in: high G+C Gram-positive bacteria)]|uniref:ABC transporter ATP-binding protein n=1 Tax=unclassified Rothia (in: high G+C Gram-positive bacteria) TaxID=2689056 RepID=UPI001EF74603|nr:MULTISPECIES: ABC transporter ATP-binding protein [unclassified Rothia (in: high G+C Gram-positive bacteria)]